MKSALMLMLALAPVMANADTRSDIAAVDSKYDRCMQSEDGQSNAGMKGCTFDAYEAVDKILNRDYKTYVKQLSGKDADSKESLKRLVASQRAWIAFRDANSSLAGIENLNGSGESLSVAMKLLDMVKARTIELADLLGSSER